MNAFDAAHRLLATVLAFSLLVPGAARAQDDVPAQAASPIAWPASGPPKERPWFYKDSDVPMDDAWHFGTLPNGLRYAVRRNDVPAGVVAIRVGIDVGSIMEKPEEAGFAHFIEHLSFRGSRDAPDGESKRIWQRLGAEFGVDSNAQTTATQTSFAVNLPTSERAGIDESLKILAGMVAAPNISAEPVEAERAIVLAERRESLGPAARITDLVQSFFFAGQPIADHPIIGTEESISGATVDALKAFHQRWYRPDRTVVAISGDADPDMLEELVRERFSSWQGDGPTPPMPDFGRPDPKAPATKVVVAPDLTASIKLVYLRPWVFHQDTIAFNQSRAVDDLALQLINRRLALAARRGASFLDAQVTRDDSFRSVSGTYVTIVPLGDDWEKALSEVRAIIEDAKRTEPSKADIDREFVAVTGFLSQAVATSRIQSSPEQADNILNALDIRETAVTPEVQYDIYTGGRQFMTPEQVRDSTRRMFTGDAVRVLLQLKQPQNSALARLDSALRRPVQPAVDVRLDDTPVTMASLPALPEAGKVAITRPVGLLGIEQIVFENGTTLYLKPNKSEPGKVRISVRFGHGQQSFSPHEKAALWAAPMALMASGIGNLDSGALEELLNGRQLTLDFSIDEDAFVMSALTSPDDYKDQLRLYAAKLAFPRWDARPLERTLAALRLTYDPVAASASEALNRNVSWLLRDKDERVAPPTPADADELTLEKFRDIWEPRLANGPIEIQLFGDVDHDEAIAAVAETFGALPLRPETVPPAEFRVRTFPAPSPSPVVLTHSGTPEQAGVVIAWPTGGGEEAIKDSRQLSVLARIINDRLFEKFRSVDGAAYTPSAMSIWPEAYDSGGYLMVQTQLRPERIPDFFQLMDDIAADLASTPVSKDELDREVEPLRQYLSRARNGNAYWMSLLEGLSRNPRRLYVAQSMAPDLLSVSAADVQEMARKYLRPDRRWSAVVLAEGVMMPVLGSGPPADQEAPTKIASADSRAPAVN